MNNTETAKLKVEIEGDEAQQTFLSLQQEAKEINKALRDMKNAGEEGSDAWKELKNRQKEVNDEFKETVKALDLNDASMVELNAKSRQLNSELKDLKVGSDAWLSKMEEIANVNVKLDETRQEMTRLKQEAIENSEAYQTMKRRQEEVNDEMKAMVRNVDNNTASMAQLQAKSDLLNKELKDLAVGSDDWLDKMKEVQDVDGRLEKVRREVKGLKDDVDENTGAWDTFKGAFSAAFTFELVAEAAEAIYEFGQDVVETTAKFEKYNAILETTLGSSEAGAAAFQMLTEFAAKTNFGVDELTDSYIKMANRGLRPGQEELMKMADVANATGKPMGDLVEAINDINNTDRWNELGIKAQTNGDKVSLTFKGVTHEVARTEEGVMGAITAFGEMEGVMGMTAKISDTLDGQLSNLDDNFDRLKVTIGNDSSGAFKDLVKVGNELIDVFIDVWKGTTPIRESFGEVVDVGVRFGGTLETLIRTLFNYDDKAKGSTIIVDAITIAFRLVGTVLISSVAAIQLVADGFSALINKGKEVANFFGAEFKINPKANFDTLAKNFEANGKAMDKLWADGETKRETTTKTANANILTDQKKTGEAVTAEAKKEAEKRAKDAEKAEADSQKKIADMKVKAIADEGERKVAEINLQYDREEAAVKKSLASAATKNTQLKLLAEAREAAISKAEEEALKKKEKQEADVAKKLDDLKAKNAVDDTARKLAALDVQAKADMAFIAKNVTDGEKRAEALRLIEESLSREKQKINDKHREDEQKKNDKLRDDEFKATKQLFDNEFKEAVALSDAKLLNAKDNANQIYQAKLDRLKAEWQYNTNKLNQEAAEEKAKNEAMIQDADRRATADKAIDDRLKAQLTANDTKYESDKTRLHAENLAKRKADADQFFGAIEKAMDGDFSGFMTILNKKLANDKAANQTKLQDNLKTTGSILDMASEALTLMTQMNQKYLESQLAKITKEKNTQLASWESQYKTGKINKEEYEAGVKKINDEYAAKEKEEKLQAWRRDKALRVGQAIIGGAQAAVMSLATMGWPLGLIGVAAAAVMTGAQIAIINRQQPPDFARGGVRAPGHVKNAGVVKGSRHGNKYGEAGIAMVDRRTNQEVGELEGDEPVMILSRNTYKNNRETVDKLLHSSLHRNGAPIHKDGGNYGDYVGEKPKFGRGGIKNRKMYLYGGVEDTLSDDGGSGQVTGGGDSGANFSGTYYDGDTSYITDSPEVAAAAGERSSTQAQIEQSQKTMTAIATNTEDTVSELKDIKTFLAGPFLNTLKNQNDDFTANIKGQVGSMVQAQNTSNGYLDRIAAKDLSVSVQTVVNVWNQINVVNDKSDMKP